MKVFTYFEYVKVIHTLRLNAVLELAEESTNYKLEHKKTEKTHDKLIKNILKDNVEMANFINQFLNPNEKIEEENLIRYTNSFITKKYQGKEADLVYKLKNKDVYFLVEHQSTIDNNMPFRMLNYSICIMQEWNKNRKIRKNTKYPIVVPILIYTGSDKWNIPKNFQQRQIGDYIFSNYKINYEFNIVDINKLYEKELLKSRTMFGYSMLIEKSKSEEELKNYLELIIGRCNKRKQLEELGDIILYLLKGILKEKEQEQLLKKIQKKVGDGNMSSWLDTMIEKNRNYEGKKYAKNMIKEKFEDQVILRITEITKKDLKELKKEIEMEK